MENIFLQKLEDVQKRKFPVIYKYVIETISEKESIHDGMVFNSPEKDAKITCLKYHKPISKV